MGSVADEHETARAHAFASLWRNNLSNPTRPVTIPGDVALRLTDDVVTLAAREQTLRQALERAKDDLKWFRDYSGPDGRAEAVVAIERCNVALFGPLAADAPAPEETQT